LKLARSIVNWNTHIEEALTPITKGDLLSTSTPFILPDLVVVTGAGRGIGRSIALHLAAAGAHVLCISRTANAETTATTIRDSGGKADAMVLDIGQYADSQKTLNRWMKGRQYSRISVVLAAAVLGPNAPLHDSSLLDWEKSFKVNVLGNLAVAQTFLQYQISNKFGRILFFAGGGAAYAYPIFPAYAATKTAIIRIVENLHEDLKDKGNFAVAALAPGAVDTDTLAEVRASGGYVRTVVGIEEPTSFANAFVTSSTCAFSGCFVHVRDSWADYLNGHKAEIQKDLWKLRRIE